MPLAWLPADVHFHVLQSLPISTTAEQLDSAKALARYLQVNSELRQVASTSLLWEPFYRARYRHYRPSYELERTRSSKGNYRLMYATRRNLDKNALLLLNHIIHTRRDRLPRAESLVELSWDVWDMLEVESQVHIPPFFDLSDNAILAEAPDPSSSAITRKFWAKSVQGIISQRYAVESVWSRLLTEGEEANAQLHEESISALSCFFNKSPFDIAVYFDALSMRCREYLSSHSYTLDVKDNSFDLANLCRALCDFLYSEDYGPMDMLTADKVLNLFPHSYTGDTKRTIPLCLCHVYVALARRLGIDASPIDFPMRVLVRVSAPEPNSEVIFVDVYGSQQKAILSESDDLRLFLQQAGTWDASTSQFTAPAPPVRMLNRAVRNIIHAQHSAISAENVNHDVDFPADYAAFCVLFLLGHAGSPQLISHMMRCINVPALDCATFLLPTLAPLLHPRTSKFMSDECELITREYKAQCSIVRRRSDGPNEVKYFVGMVFDHVKYGYRGVIIQWDYNCEQSEEWMVQMRVGALPRGRNQPFYSSLSISGAPRYVAEENIRPISPTPADIQAFYRRYPTFSLYFSGADFSGDIEYTLEGRLGRMLPSPESREAYPEDCVQIVPSLLS